MSRSALRAWALRMVRPDLTGVVFATMFFCASMTPSLLPRDWLSSGVIGGINVAVGYGAGVVAGVLTRALVRRAFRGRRLLEGRTWWPLPKPARRVLTAGVGVVCAGASLAMVVPAAAWQRQVATLMGVEGPATATYLRAVALAFVLGAALIGTARLLREVISALARLMIRRWRINDEVALFIGSAIVVIVAITVVNGVLLRGLLSTAAAAHQPQDSTTRTGVVQPHQAERSGSPASFAGWDTLGFQGRNFTGTGPTAAELTELNGRPAKEPIRIYAGLQTAPSIEARVAVLMSELQRTRAFERKVLVIMPTTGTGWVDPVAARAIESMYNGDTALVGMQYSFLPSWLSFLTDRRISMEAGRAMIDAIGAGWRRQPEDRRPMLALYGESLGAMAGQAAFGFLPDVAEQNFSAVLWVGPPNGSRLWKDLTVRRDPGTPEVQPRYDNGRTVRFAQAANSREVAAVAAVPSWSGTRVLYLQHASDPVVWWSPDLLVRQPDWLKEPPGIDRTPSMRWYPLVTFLQVSADVAGNITDTAGVPSGHGHKYGDTLLDGWVAVAAPTGWTTADTDRIRRGLDRAMSAGGPEFL